MRELLSYGGVTTKIRAMKKNLFSDEEFRELVSLKNMEEVYRFLADTDAYREALAPLAGSEIHREMIETAIDGALYKDFSKIYNFADPAQERFLKKYARRYEISTLKKALSRIASGSGVLEGEPPHKAFFDKFTQLDVGKIAKASDLNELIRALEGTPYHEVMTSTAQRPGAEIFDYETALDMYHFRDVWRDRKRIVPEGDVDTIAKAYGSRVDMLNLWFIRRAKVWYDIKPEEISQLILPVQYKLKRSEITELIAAPDEESFAQILKKTYYGRRYEELRPDNLEDMYVYVLKNVLRREAREKPYSAASMFSYLYLREHQSYKVTAAIECVRYQLPQDEALRSISVF